MRFLTAFLFFSCVGQVLMRAQEMHGSGINIDSVIEEINSKTELVEVERTSSYKKISPRTVNSLKVGQNFNSVTHMLGVPPIVEPIVELERKPQINPSTAEWYVIYMHSNSNKIYYQMLFSGENGNPANLLEVEAFFDQGKRKISIGFLSLDRTSENFGSD